MKASQRVVLQFVMMESAVFLKEIMHMLVLMHFRSLFFFLKALKMFYF